MTNNKEAVKSETRVKSESDKYLTQMAIPTIFFILKRYSSEKQPLSVNDIVEKAQYLMKGEDGYSEAYVLTVDTVKAKLNMLADMSVSDNEFATKKTGDQNELRFKNAMAMAFGGTIVEVSVAGNTERKKKARCNYYFKPILNEADVNMVCGAIAGNRYFSEAEKDFLISSQEAFYGKPLAGSASLTPDNKLALPSRPSVKNKKTDIRPSHSTQDMLRIINILHFAIANGFQVKVTTAQYQVNERSHKLSFEVANNARYYYLHPYALFWSVGQLYLLGTFTYSDQLRHYRVDRIFDIEIAYQKNDEKLTDKPRLTNPLPESLMNYRKMQSGRCLKHPGKHGKPVIDTDKYVAAHPLMSIFDSTKALLPTVVLECDAPSLPIIIDTFGAGIYVEPSSLPHEEESDQFGRKINYYTVHLHNVQPECMTLYCAQHHRSLSVIAPEELRQDVLEIIKKSARDLS